MYELGDQTTGVWCSLILIFKSRTFSIWNPLKCFACLLARDPLVSLSKTDCGRDDKLLHCTVGPPHCVVRQFAAVTFSLNQSFEIFLNCWVGQWHQQLQPRRVVFSAWLSLLGKWFEYVFLFNVLTKCTARACVLLLYQHLKYKHLHLYPVIFTFYIIFDLFFGKIFYTVENI